MNHVVIDAATMERLHYLTDLLEVRDEAGHVLGYFHPLYSEEGKTPASPFSDEEIEKRRQQRTGSPLSEVLSRLARS